MCCIAPVSSPSRFDELEAALAALLPAELEIIHHHENGVYIRELRIPAGTILTGKKHRHSCLNIVTGDISVYNDAGQVAQRITGHAVFSSPAGTRRVGFAHLPTIWETVHPTNETDLDKIEAEFIEPHVNPLLESGRALN